jgi:PDZ domain
MHTFTSLNKKTLALLLIAATGLPASMAMAQFKVDYAAKAESASSESKDHSVMIFKEHEGDHVYEIKLENGDVVFATVDGDELDLDRVKVKAKFILLIDDDGEVLHKIEMPETPHTTKSWKSKDGDEEIVLNNQKYKVLHENQFFDNGNGEIRIQSAFAPEDGTVTLDLTQIQSPPKVMLGINLSEPSPALRKHLRLKDGMHAILVENVIDGLPAAKAGLEDFDVIVSLDGSDQADGKILGKILAEKEPGDTLKILVLRGGDKIKLKVKLASYDGEALGMKSIVIDSFPAPHADDRDGTNLEFFIDEDGDKSGELIELRNLKGKLRKQFGNSQEQRVMAEEMHKKALEAMRDAERQMLEFRDGKLIVRSAEQGEDRWNVLRGRVQNHLNQIAPDGLAPHMEGMEKRLAELESRLDRQIDEMSVQMDRLTSMFERLMNALEDDDD